MGTFARSFSNTEYFTRGEKIPASSLRIMQYSLLFSFESAQSLTDICFIRLSDGVVN
jgi:hypothetical protein